MSRNSDKANTVLFRYQEQKAEEAGHIDYNSTARPRSVQKVNNLKDAENWRKQVLKEISQKVTKIQDAQLSSYQIRDLNDEINKLMREKLAWEYHIKEKLNGPDYLKSAGSRFNEGGVLIRGYRYFGRAKELPGVKEILEKQQQDIKEKKDKHESEKSQKQKIRELESRVNLEYYGYFDEQKQNNGKLVSGVWDEVEEILGADFKIPKPYEDAHNQEILKDELLKFERSATRKRSKKLSAIQNPKEIIIIEENEPPSQQQVEAYLVERRREQLSAKYDI